MKKTALMAVLLFAVVGLVMTGCYPTSNGCDGSTNPNPGDNGSTTPALDPGTVAPSPGCSNRNFSQSGTYTLDIDGTQREYIVTLPDNYDPDQLYRLVFAWHYLGGTAAGIAGNGGSFSYYGLKGRSDNSAIFVAGQGLTSGGSTGWPNTGGRDVAFAKALYNELSGDYCVDESRVFSTGMSYGGIMSNTVGCKMGDVFRAIAPMSGMGPGYGGFGAQCTGQVAAWMSHGNTDSIVPFNSGQASRDHWVEANSCSDQTSPISPSPCVAYEGCDEGYPVTWCEFDGGHTIPGFASDAIWNFFKQF